MKSTTRVDYYSELAYAHKVGRQSEIADLMLLIANRERQVGAPPITGSKAASNRQAQRRFTRRTTPDQNSSHNPDRKVPQVGDYVRCPNGVVELVTGQDAYGRVTFPPLPGLKNRTCPIGMVTIVDGPEASAPATVAPRDARFDACETLYGACWDAVESGGPDLGPAVERALRAYEATLEALGA